MKAETIETDVLIIGGGSAGCEAALVARARGARVLMVVKGKMGRSGATPLASCLGTPAKFPGSYRVLRFLKNLYSMLNRVLPLPLPGIYERAMRMMLSFHFWLVDQDYFLESALWSSKKFFPALEESGLYVLRDDDGEPIATRGNGYYVIHSHGMTGYQYGESKRKDVLDTDVQVMEEATAFSLLGRVGGEVTGAMVLDYLNGKLYAVNAKTTIIATGHTNWLSKRSTGTREMAANGLAMAARAGAELQNLEIQWFHATDMASPDSWTRLHHYPNPLTGTDHRVQMVNDEGEAYMRVEEYDTVMPYTIQMKKLYEQVEQGKARWDGGNFADFSGVEPEALERYQYHWEFYQKLGKSMATDRFESGITWHMSAGGVRADVKTMQTRVARLYIAGAVGGHMLGGLNLAAYDGALAGEHAADTAARAGLPKWDLAQVRGEEQRINDLLSGVDPNRNEPTVSPTEIKRRIREVVWDDMMYAKTGEGLKRALSRLDEIAADVLPTMRLTSAAARYNNELVDALDVQDMLDVCRMAARASLAREESRGPHFRTEFPQTDNDQWLKHIVVSLQHDAIQVRYEPVPQQYLRPKPGRADYLADPYL